MTENQFTYWAFLSHCQQDNCEKRADTQDRRMLCWGDWLRDELRAFSIPTELVGQLNARGEIIPERLEPIFHEPETGPETASLSEKVREALDQSKYLIVICSPRSAKSVQVNEQVRYFKQLGRGNRILPIVIAGEPNAGDGHTPGRPPEEECLAPALRHPVLADGSLDTSRRERASLFADARRGDAGQEITADDRQNGAIELETAKTQLIAGLLGVAFNGLWDHELKRRFMEATILARELRSQNLEGRVPDEKAQSQVREAQQQAQEALSQVAEARDQARAAEARVLEAQQLAQEARNQAEEAQRQARELENKFLESQNQVSQAQSRAEELAGQTQRTQSQLAEARNQAQAGEAKFLEAQRLAGEAQNQLEEARQQIREAQNQVLEARNLPPEVQQEIEVLQKRLQEAQDEARKAHEQATEIRQHVQACENKVRESQDQSAAAQNQVRELESQVRQTQIQLAAAHGQAGAAESKVLETQEHLRQTQNQIAEAQNQAREFENKFLESQNQVHRGQARIQEIEQQVQQTQIQLADAHNQARTAENQVLAAQNKIQEIENQSQATRSQIQEVQSRSLEAQAEVRRTQNHVWELQSKNKTSDRRTKVLALITVLALMAAGTSVWPRKQSASAPTTNLPPAVAEPELASGPLTGDQIQQALQQAANHGKDEAALRNLDELAARIPAEEISNTLNASSAILADPQRSRFQESLVNRWITTNLPAALDWIGQLTNADSRQRVLENVIPALAADNPTNTLARLIDLKPAADAQTYLRFFQRWAATDPLQAIAQRDQIPGHDADARILSAIITVWAEQQPAAALNWLESQPDSESVPSGTWRTAMMADVFDHWAAKDLEGAATACQQLPEGPIKERAGERILNRRIAQVPATAAEFVKNLAPGDSRQEAIAELCRHWGDTDAPAALAWVTNLPAEDDRVNATNAILVRWADNDPPAASQFASQHPELSGAVFSAIADAWSRRDLAATTNWVGTLPDGEKKDTVLLGLAGSVADRSPLVAAKLCTVVTTNQPTTALVQGIATSLAKMDITNAVAWARDLKEESAREAALSALAEPWAQWDPQGMAAYALGLPAGEAQRQLLTTACRPLARRDLAGMVTLLTPLSDDGLRQKILEEAGRDAALLHPEQAAKYISTMPPGDDQEAAIKGLVSNWAATDPEAAANWLLAFPGTNAQPEQVQSVIKAWSQPEPAAVAKWLANLSAGTASDEMIGAFLHGAALKYPRYAADWTQSVTDETKRQTYEIQVARQWMNTDPAEAVKWIDSLNLPEEMRQSLKGQPLPPASQGSSH